jgi:endonuclease YncB( thermonuclease family)
MSIEWDKINNKCPVFSLEGQYIVGKCVDVYDGDTVKVVMPLIIDDKITSKLYRWNCRINRVDTPELRTKNLKEKQYGYEVRNKLREKILNKMIYVKCLDFDKYGRLLTELYVNNEYCYDNINSETCAEKLENISDWLINNEYAKEYFGGTKNKWFVE